MPVVETTTTAAMSLGLRPASSSASVAASVSSSTAFAEIELVALAPAVGLEIPLHRHRGMARRDAGIVEHRHQAVDVGALAVEHAGRGASPRPPGPGGSAAQRSRPTGWSADRSRPGEGQRFSSCHASLCGHMRASALLQTLLGCCYSLRAGTTGDGSRSVEPLHKTLEGARYPCRWREFPTRSHCHIEPDGTMTAARAAVKGFTGTGRGLD